MTRITLLNGPNLNLLGEREPHIYGATSLSTIEANCGDLATSLGIELHMAQSNREGELVELYRCSVARKDETSYWVVF